MVHRIGLCLLLGLSLWASSETASEGLPPRPTVKVFAEGSGLPSLACQGLVQDPKGRVWVATQQGVAWFGGGLFHSLEGQSEFNQTWVTTLYANSTGLWVGTAADGVLCWGPQGWKAWKTAEGNPLRRIHQCLEDGQGRLLVLSLGNRVLRVEGDQLVPQEGMPPFPVTRLLQTPDGWLAASDQGLWRETSGRWARVEEIKGEVLCLATSEGRILVGSDRGAYLGSGGIWTPLSGLDGEVLQSACSGPGPTGGEVFWAASRQKLFCIEQGRAQDVPLVSHGAPPQIYQVATTEAQGARQIWLSTYSGVFRLQPGGWNPLEANQGPGHTISFGLARSREGGLWFGDGKGRLHRFQENRWRSWDVEAGKAKSVVSGLCALEGAGGSMLAALTQSGMWFWDGRAWKNSGWGELRVGAPVMGLKPGRYKGEAGAWAGTERGLFFWSLQRGLVKVVAYDRPIYWVLPDPSDPERVYFGGMTEEVLLWSGGTFGRVIAFPGCKFTGSAEWVRGQEGQIFMVGTFAGGVYSVDVAGKTRAHWAKAALQGWPSDAILSLACDAEGRTWVGTDAGLAVMSAEGNLLNIYTREDGLPADLCTQNALVIEGRQRVWTSTSRGVAQLPLAGQRSSALPALQLLALTSQAGPFRPDATLRHPARQVVLAFDLPQLHREGDIRYRSMLEGLDMRLGPWSTDARAIFPTLPAGSYRLKVWAMDGNGQQVGPLVIPFKVAPPLWLHPVMLVLYALALGLAGFALVRYKTARLKERNHELSEAVATATGKLHVINDRLYRLNDEKNRIIGVAAHDLRNPLSALLLICELMKDDIPEALAPDLERIRQLGRSMNDLMSDLLNVHAIEANAAEAPRLEVMDANELLREVHGSFAARAEGKFITLNLDLRQGAASVLGDRRHLQRVLDNLVSNALKFTPSHRQIWLRSREVGTQFCLEIQDEGPGLTPEDLSQVFGAYARLSAQPTAGESSVGLGLSIVKKLTEGMGGAIGVDSIAGQGATFWVRLPKPPVA